MKKAKVSFLKDKERGHRLGMSGGSEIMPEMKHSFTYLDTIFSGVIFHTNLSGQINLGREKIRSQQLV